MNPALRFAGALCSFVLLVASTSSGQVAHPESLPYFDVRFDDGIPIASVEQAKADSRTVAEQIARQNAKQLLLNSIPGLRIDDHEIFDTPHFVASTMRFLTGVDRANRTPLNIARDFVDTHKDLFEINANELENARLRRDFVTRHNGVTHLTAQQQINGIDLHGAVLKANVTVNGELINISSSMLPRPAGDFQPPAVTITPLEAIRSAAASIGVSITVDPVPLTEPQGVIQKQTWSQTPDFRPDEDITTELIYFPLSRLDIRPAWSLVLPEIGIGNTYEIIVDATTGAVLRRWNRLHFESTQPISMRVHVRDNPAPGSPGTDEPNGFQFPEVPRDFVTLEPADVTDFSPNHWIDDGDNETFGNNVDAHTDIDANNSPDLPRPQGNPFRVFDFPMVLEDGPAAYRDAAVTQLFYYCNLYHDRLYALGFDEVAGNYQATNFGLGGAGGDRVSADAQDGAGINNANFTTNGSDGSSGRMQMFIFPNPNPDRDGDLDAEIVYHEYSHGLSIRLHEGTLNGEQARGMGEGWGDFFGVALNAEPGDDPHGTYTTGSFATYLLWSNYTDNYYFGIRRFPYSTDMNKNPQTYADTDPGQQSYPPGVPRNTNVPNTADEVHNLGETWAVTLNECRANLWEIHGFPANELLMQLVVDGMKLSVPNPNFLQARDAILQADLVNNGGANLTALWSGFAKRGMGASAASPNGNSTTGVLEAFDAPNLLNFSYPAGIPTQLQPGLPTAFQVEVLGLGDVIPIPDTGLLHYSINGGSFTSISMVETSENSYDATLPPFNCFEIIDFYVSVDTAQGVRTDPPDAPVSTRGATVFTGTTELFSDNFETDLGWTAQNLGATSGDWQRGVPVNDPGWAHDPASDSDGSGQCYLTQNEIGNTDVDDGAVRLISPTIDMSDGLVLITYDYFLRLTVDDGLDRLLVEISSNDGAGPWTEIARHDTDGGLSWRSHAIDPPALSNAGVGLTSIMKMRFTANDANEQSINEAGLDAFVVSKLECDLSEPTCDDGVQNQGEDLIDCGGPCDACTCLVDAACDDTVFCNGQELCDDFGQCQFADAPCPEELCIEEDDFCIDCLENADCDDGIFCNGAETCDGANNCVLGVELDCDDEIECTLDSCNEQTDSCDHDFGNCPGVPTIVYQPGSSTNCELETAGVRVEAESEVPISYQWLKDGIEVAGATEDVLIFDAVDESDEGAYTCLVSNDFGEVESEAGILDVVTSLECADGSFCNGVEVCVSLGECTDGPDPCVDLDHCDELSDSCVECLGDGECDDGEFCNGAESCVAGVCVAGDPPCEVGQVCNEDQQQCVGCLEDSDCDDGLFCNGNETCDTQNNECLSGDSVDCDDGVDCTSDACDDISGSCDNIPIDSACDNGVICDGSETCDPDMGCLPGTPIEGCCKVDGDCNDGNVCTGMETCVLNSCVPGANLDCGDELFCNGVETCDAIEGCQVGADPCNDPGFPACNEDDDICEADVTSCEFNADCQDDDVCTSDVCAASICTFDPRLYGDADNDGKSNILDVICAARVIFQNETVCGAHEVSLDEIDIAPSADCGDESLDILDLVVHARVAFQGALDECCGE